YIVRHIDGLERTAPRMWIGTTYCVIPPADVPGYGTRIVRGALAVVLVIAIGSPAIAGGGGTPGFTREATAGDTLGRMHAAGELRWGADAQGGAPYVFQDPVDPTHLIGFEVELADALAHALGVRARPVSGQWESLLDLLARGDFDVALNGIEV